MDIPGGTDQYIVPDILMEKDGEELKIRLNDDYGSVIIQSMIIMSKMMEQAEDSELKEYFRKKYERCRFIITSIEQRRRRCLRFQRQFLTVREYFMNHKQLKPMTMQNIADDIENACINGKSRIRNIFNIQVERSE